MRCVNRKYQVGDTNLIPKNGKSSKRSPRSYVVAVVILNCCESNWILIWRFACDKFRKVCWTIAPAGFGQAGGETERAPRLIIFRGFKNAGAPRVLCKISGSMVSHCLPQAYAKRGARPNEPPALEFFGGLKNTDAPRVL